MPLQNRVSPFGEIFASPARGTWMGNRGGRLHDARRRLTTRRWVTRAWICCKLKFNNRHRNVWSDGYTELFFLDEITALAVGHRPCFECRRKDAELFALLFSGRKKRASATSMDKALHTERMSGKAKRTHRRKLDKLPDGAMVALDGVAFAIRDKQLLQWTPSGYSASKPCPPGIEVDVLTPPTILSILARGYTPGWHPSAARRSTALGYDSNQFARAAGVQKTL